MKSANLKSNAFYNLLKTVSTIFIPLIVFPYVTRVLLPDNIGKVNFAISFVSYFALIASLGVSTYAIREASIVKTDQNALNKFASEVFSLNVITTIISYIIFFITLFCFKEFAAYKELIIIQSFSILLTTFGADWINSAMEDFKYIAIRTFAIQILVLILTFTLVKKPEDLYIYMAINLLSSSGSNIINFFYRRKFCRIKFTFKINLKKHFKPILLLFVMSLAQIIFTNVDITMLGIICNDYEVGIYSTALKLTHVIGQIVQSAAFVLIPRLSVLFERNDYSAINKLLRKILNFNITLGLPSVVGTIMIAEDIILIIGGPEFHESANLMRILILSFMFSLVGGSFVGNAILIPNKQEKYYMYACIGTAVSNLILNLILIPYLGAMGAAIATASNGFVLMILLLFKVDKTKIKITRLANLFIGPVVGCSLIALVCFGFYYVDNFVIRIVFSIVCSIIIYGISLLIFKNDLVFEMIEIIKKKINSFIQRRNK